VSVNPLRIFFSRVRCIRLDRFSSFVFLVIEHIQSAAMSISKFRSLARSTITLPLLGSYQSMMNNNNNNPSTASAGSSSSNSSAGAPMSLAAANVVRGIMEKVLTTPPMGATLSSSSSSRLFNELDYLSSPGFDSDFGETSPLLCAPTTTTNQYFRLPIGNPSTKDNSHCFYGHSR
jgi:hypothetical protein